MAKLHNINGNDYEIVGSKKSEVISGHKDYLCKTPSDATIIVRGWRPERKDWVSSDFYGWDSVDFRDAQRDFLKSKAKSKAKRKK